MEQLLPVPCQGLNGDLMAGGLEANNLDTLMVENPWAADSVVAEPPR